MSEPTCQSVPVRHAKKGVRSKAAMLLHHAPPLDLPMVPCLGHPKILHLPKAERKSGKGSWAFCRNEASAAVARMYLKDANRVWLPGHRAPEASRHHLLRLARVMPTYTCILSCGHIYIYRYSFIYANIIYIYITISTPIARPEERDPQAKGHKSGCRFSSSTCQPAPRRQGPHAWRRQRSTWTPQCGQNNWASQQGFHFRKVVVLQTWVLLKKGCPLIWSSNMGFAQKQFETRPLDAGEGCLSTCWWTCNLTGILVCN